MAKFTSVIICLILSLIFIQPSQASPQQESFKAHALTVVVQSLLEGNQAGIGAGVIVSQERDLITVISADHILLSNRIQVVDDRRHNLPVVNVRHFHDDFAFITARVMDGRIFPVATFGSPVEGRVVFLYGHPAGKWWEFAEGSVLHKMAHVPLSSTKAPSFSIDCPTCDHGDSGAGVFDAEGHLLGVITSAWMDAHGNKLFIQVMKVGPEMQIY